MAKQRVSDGFLSLYGWNGSYICASYVYMHVNIIKYTQSYNVESILYRYTATN